MERLSKISRVVDKILKVGYWLLVIASAVTILVFGVLTFLPPFDDISMEGTWTIGMGKIDLELAEQVVMNNKGIQAESIEMMMVVFVMAVIGCYGIKLLRKILAPMIKEQPFVGTVSGDLKKLGWVMICGSVIFSIVQNVGAALIYSAFDIQNLLLSDKIVGVKLNFLLVDAKTILTGVLLFMLSHVFSYGEKLQQQDDETL